MQYFTEDFIEFFKQLAENNHKEWQHAYEKEPLIANKQFYFVAEETPELITSQNLVEKLMNYWKIMHPVNEYLTKVIK